MDLSSTLKFSALLHHGSLVNSYGLPSSRIKYEQTRNRVDFYMQIQKSIEFYSGKNFRFRLVTHIIMYVYFQQS